MNIVILDGNVHYMEYGYFWLKLRQKLRRFHVPFRSKL